MAFGAPVFVSTTLFMLSGVLGCGNSAPPAVVPDQPDANATARAMETLDTNHDGFLDEKELEKAPGLKAALKQVDTNNDGKISQEELAARIAGWAESKMGRMPVNCRVTHNGNPFEGAMVTLVPESFLGGTLQSGSAAVAESGYAAITAPYSADAKVTGMSPGFYRVEVTKQGEKIPAKYNTETTLGVEVGCGSEMEKLGLRFDIKY